MLLGNCGLRNRPQRSSSVPAGARSSFSTPWPREQGTIRKLWSWTASTEHGLKEEQLKHFRNLDECKPLDGGKLLLVCASNSGCALLERATGKVRWSAAVTNAHSVERLPGGRIIAASSLSGDRLVLFDPASATPAKPLWTTPLKSAHGLVWDEPRGVLWALGFDELRRYTLVDWKTATPALELQKTIPLPDEDGHDLRPCRHRPICCQRSNRPMTCS